MHKKIVYFSLLRQPTTSRFVKPVCGTAHYLCQLANKDVLSFIDLFSIQDFGFQVWVLREEKTKH